MSDQFVYALKERIGYPVLFSGRQQELQYYLDWAHSIERKASSSLAILSRRKSGKTSLLQRIYNIIWNENKKVIPFYIEIEDKPKWIREFCQEYYLTFYSQYYSFKLRMPEYSNTELSLEDIKEIAINRKDQLILRKIPK